MQLLWLDALLIASFAASVFSQCYYSVVGPGLLKPNRKYTVAATLHVGDNTTTTSTTSPTTSCTPNVLEATMLIGITGPSFNKSEKIVIRAGETKQIDFLPGRLTRGAYYLHAEGLSGIIFKDETELYAHYIRNYYIHIQTDKAYYKPKDLVQFRVVIFDEYTRPVNISEPIKVEILDGNSNRVKQFKDIKLVHGVFTQQLQLSEAPVMGKWKIIATISGLMPTQKSKIFVVQKYVLDKFEIVIQSVTDVTPSDRSIKALVWGKYTFGKYVRGNVSIALTDSMYGEYIEEKKLNVTGVGSVEFELKDTPKYTNVDEYVLLVSMTEALTGKGISKEHVITRHKEDYNIELLPDGIAFRYGVPYRLKVKIQHWNGSPLSDVTTPVHMTYGNQSYATHCNADGVAEFEFAYDQMSEHTIMFKNSLITLPNIWAAQTSDHDSIDVERPLTLKLKEESLRFGNIAEVEVSAGFHLPYFVYTITGHANIVHMGYVTMPQNTKSYIIKIDKTAEVVPHCIVYVHYIKNGHLKYAELTVKFPPKFLNEISVTAPKEVAPGSKVTLNIRAQPNSYVCLLAVDLSVYLWDSSYDLQRYAIISDVANDVSYTPIDFITKYPGVQSGLVTMTNANYKYDTLYCLTWHCMKWAHVATTPPSTFHANYLSRKEEEGREKVFTQNPIVFRERFPETWLFENVEVTKENTELTYTIPDTITTWRITAFSMHPHFGFGIVDGPTDILTILPFFINLNLPYSVKSGEILSLPVTIFNYHNQSVDAEITLYGNGREFEFVEAIPSNQANPEKRQALGQNVTVPSGEGEVVTYLIKAIEVGDITLNVTAITHLTSDGVIQKLRVEPGGDIRTDNRAMLLDIVPSKLNVAELRANIPRVIVPKSESLTLSVGANALAHAMRNLNALVRRPTGCGEQNMVNFVPNILIMQHLKSTGKFRKEKKLFKRALQYIEIGYQQELSYRHESGGFSPFGEKEDKGEASTWLTAYVARFFMKASKFVSIEKRIISSGLDYLADQQLESGEFPFTGYLFYPAQQNKYGFTAFVLMTFLEEKKYSRKHKAVIEKALKFLDDKWDSVQDIYALSIMAVALQMAKHESAQAVLEKVMLQKRERNGHIWWSNNDKNSEKDVEITAYAMLALMAVNEDVSGILQWLIRKRNANGGFKSTHDTVVGLQALVKFSERLTDELQMNLTYTAEDELGNVLQSDQLTLDANSDFGLNAHKLPPLTRAVRFTASGKGQSTVQLSSIYHVDDAEPMEHFKIEPNVELTTKDQFTLDICFVYQPSTAAVSKQEKLKEDRREVYSNMVIMEVNLPTGFMSDAANSVELHDEELVQRVEAKNSETIIVLYLDKLLADAKNCLAIDAYRTHEAKNLKASPIVMYDYYNTTRKNSKFYTLDE